MVFTENWKVFSPKSSEDQKSPKIIQRSQADLSQIIGGIQSIFPHSPGFLALLVMEL